MIDGGVVGLSRELPGGSSPCGLSGNSREADDDAEPLENSPQRHNLSRVSVPQ